MRLNVFIIACAIFLTSEAALRFTESVWYPDLGFSAPRLEGGVGTPQELPRASAFLVTDNGTRRLEDRFETFDLWAAETIRGCWTDASGNVLTLMRLSTLPPNDAEGTTRTRHDYAARQRLRALGPKDSVWRDLAVKALAPVEIKGDPFHLRRAQRRNLIEVLGYPVSDDSAVVVAFRPRTPNRGEEMDWYVAVLIRGAGTSLAEARIRLDEDFLDKISVPARRSREALNAPPQEGTEADLLRRDLRRSIVNYDEWQCTDVEELVVLDNLDRGLRTSFLSALTNELPRLRQVYAATVPSPLVATNQVAIVRVFKTREEYLSYVGEGHEWTGGCWIPARRELVTCSPAGTLQDLKETIWHEAFHQYLAYAGSMISSSPWFNEGQAELFGHSHFDAKGRLAFDCPPEAVAYVQEYAADLAQLIPDVMRMDYEEFYAGTQQERRARYFLAWSIAYFLEIGAPKVRFQPFSALRADYMKALINTRSMKEASRILFTEETREAFIAAWLSFWRRQ